MTSKTLSEQSEVLTGHNGGSRRVGDEPLEMVSVDKSMAILYAKLARVMGRLNPIVPDGMNTYFKYPYQTAGAIANAVRVELAAENVAFLINMVSVDQSQKGKTKAVFHFTFACGDTGATLTRRFEGEAEDGQDKGINKVATAATKYFLIKTFLISPADEVDPDASGGDTPKDRPAKTGNSKTKPASGTKSKPASPVAPKVEAPKDDTLPVKTEYDQQEVITQCVFMYKHGAHAANSIGKMVESKEIIPTMTTERACVAVLFHRAKSDYEFSNDDVFMALSHTSKTKVERWSQWTDQKRGLPEAWQAILDYHTSLASGNWPMEDAKSEAETDTPF